MNIIPGISDPALALPHATRRTTAAVLDCSCYRADCSVALSVTAVLLSLGTFRYQISTISFMYVFVVLQYRYHNSKRCGELDSTVLHFVVSNSHTAVDYAEYCCTRINISISVFAKKVVRPKFTQKIPPKELN